MIRNIIFDLGNVLLNWQPSVYLEQQNYSKDKRDTILNDIFRSNEWLQLDNGDITTNEAKDRIALKSALNKAEIDHVFDHRMEILYPLAENIKWLPLLKKRGFKLYYLSNFPIDLFDTVVKLHDFFSFFDGGIISAHVKVSKPDKRIYQTLLDRYLLKSEESVFIDDLIVNVVGARELGIKSIHLDDPGKLSEYVRDIILNE